MSEHANTTAGGEYDGGFFLRCPKALPKAIRSAAKDHMTSAAAYVRGAVLRQLEVDGYGPKVEES
jgi:hypothetical protein